MPEGHFVAHATEPSRRTPEQHRQVQAWRDQKDPPCLFPRSHRSRSGLCADTPGWRLVWTSDDEAAYRTAARHPVAAAVGFELDGRERGGTGRCRYMRMNRRAEPAEIVLTMRRRRCRRQIASRDLSGIA
jgi:hypothetical protein